MGFERKVNVAVARPLLLALPMPIVTPRLNLRPVQEGDGALIHAARIESDEILRPWMPWAQSLPSPEESEEYMRSQIARYILREDLMIIGLQAQTGEFVLATGFHRPRWDVGCFEIGYWVNAKFEGQGYVTEAVKALTNYAFEKMRARRVEIRCDSNNTRSFKVAERLGYEREAVLKADTLAIDGRVRDTLVYVRHLPIS
jgi:RimJ/RimL family protein N-acetyltransferase